MSALEISDDAVKFWTTDDSDEILSHTEIGEAVERWADDIHPDPIPETVTVYGFAPMEVFPAEQIADYVLDNILDYLDEDLGNPDESTEREASMKAAALEFATKLRALYTPRMCKVIVTREVRTADYLPAEWFAVSTPVSHETGTP